MRRPPPAELDSADLNLEDVVDESVDDTATARQCEPVVDAATDAEADEGQELRTHLAQQQENSMRDSLTELPNRDAYNQRLKALLHEWQHGASHDRRADDRALYQAKEDGRNRVHRVR